MNQDRTKRKLTAIFSADVVEYSRLMESDEAWTIKSLEENRRLMSSLIEEHNGRVVDAPGDNLLAEFSSVINAVKCAVKVQEELHNKNSKLMEDNRLHFRIGVNLGDVVEEEDRIYGNGVNIAARLEGLAEPGGICISGTAYDQVITKLHLEYEYLGEHSVKNIAIPVRVYRVVIDTDAARKTVGEKRFLSRIGIVGFITCIAAAISLTALIVGAVIWSLRAPEPRKVMRFSYELPEGQQFLPENIQLPISPDGSQFVYPTTDGLYLRSVDELEERPIAGTDQGSTQPVFSPDGQWIAYWSSLERKLKKIAISGGVPVVLCDTGLSVLGLSWSQDNTIVYSDVTGGGVKRVSADGGTPESIIEADAENLVTDGIPIVSQMLPDGKTILFTNLFSFSELSKNQIAIQSLESGERKILVGGVLAMYLSSGHLVYAQVNNNVASLVAVPFDLDTLEVKGGPVPLLESISAVGLSDSGTLVYVPGTSGIESASSRTLVWVDKKGNEEQIEAEPNMYRFPKISPDGTKVALTTDKSGNDDIWIYDLTYKILERLTFNDSSDLLPVWTSDGKRIIFRSDREEPGIYSKAADGTGEAEQIVLETTQILLPFSLSGDGNTLVMQQVSGLMQIDIGTLSMDDDHTHKLLLQEDYAEWHPQVSPDGKWIAYCSDETGQTEIFVRPFPEVNKGKWQISTDGGNSPLWSPDGRELFYLIEDAPAEAAMRVAVETEPTFKKGTPEELFCGTYVGFYSGDFPWAIHPDGNRFLMMKSPGTPDDESATEAPRKINIVLNWDEELKQRVPVD